MEEVAARYAEAIISIAKDENKLESYKLASLSLLEIFKENPEIFKYLKSYFVKDEDKEKIIDELTKDFKLVNFSNFIKLLIAKHRLNLFKEIVGEISKGINAELGIYEGFVYSTEPLKEKRIEEIAEAISIKLGRKVELKNKIDTRLIGGIKVVVHDHIFDGSIKYKLETMKEQLKERRNG